MLPLLDAFTLAYKLRILKKSSADWEPVYFEYLVCLGLMMAIGFFRLMICLLAATFLFICILTLYTRFASTYQAHQFPKPMLAELYMAPQFRERYPYHDYT